MKGVLRAYEGKVKVFSDGVRTLIAFQVEAKVKPDLRRLIAPDQSWPWCLSSSRSAARPFPYRNFPHLIDLILWT